MATKLEDEFDPTRINAPDAAYPAGSLKDETTPGVSDDGTPLAARVGNDWQGFSQSVLDKAGIAANGQPDSVTNPQILQAIEQMYGDGDSQLAGGNIWPLNSQESAQVGDDLTGYKFVRLQGGDFSSLTLFPVVKKNGSQTPISGSLSNVNLTTRPYDATVGTDDVWLLNIDGWNSYPNKITARSFWAIGDESADDTIPAQSAVNYGESTGITVDFQELKLGITTTIDINLSINLINVSLKPIVDLPALTPLLRVNSDDTHTVILDNLNLNGDRANQSSPGGAQDGGKHGLAFFGDCKVIANNITSYDNITDGLYYRPGLTSASQNDKVFSNVLCDNNGRQGVSVINYDRVYFKNLTTTNTNGLLPEAGVDVEPNSSVEYTGIIYFDNFTSKGNNGRGFVAQCSSVVHGIHLSNLNISDNALPESIRFTGAATADFKNITIKNAQVDKQISGKNTDISIRSVSLEDITGDGNLASISFTNAESVNLTRVKNTDQTEGVTNGWEFVDCEYVSINDCKSPYATHPSDEGTSGTSINLNGVNHIEINGLISDRVGYRGIRWYNETDGTMNAKSITWGDGLCSRPMEIGGSGNLVRIENTTFPTADDIDLYIRDDIKASIDSCIFKNATPNIVTPDNATVLTNCTNALGQASGTVTAAGVSATIVHGLIRRPTLVLITPTNAAAGSGSAWVEINNADFVIRDTAAGQSFAWSARI